MYRRYVAPSFRLPRDLNPSGAGCACAGAAMSTIKGMAQQQMDIIFHSLLEKTELIGAYVVELGKAHLRQACFYS